MHIFFFDRSKPNTTAKYFNVPVQYANIKCECAKRCQKNTYVQCCTPLPSVFCFFDKIVVELDGSP